MVRRFGITLAALSLLVGAEVWASCCATKTACATVKYQPRRSDSRHKLRQVVGLTELTHRNNHELNYGTMSFTPGFMSSFQPEHVATHLFGGDLVGYDGCKGRTIKIQGSNITGRNSKAWLADYFYLPTNYDGTFTVTPRVKTFFVDLDLYLGLDYLLCNSYFRLYGPFVATRWDLGFSENATYNNNVSGDYAAGYFTQAAYESGRLLRSFSEYACGGTPQQSDDAINNPADDDDNNTQVSFTGLKYGRMCCNPMRRNGFADLRFELGWNAFERDRWHLGFNLQGAAPTGNEPKPCYLFAPIVGNGHHWELGAGVTGHYDIWECQSGEGKVSAHLDVNITHLFKTKQYRTFDLKGKANSAYMLAARMGSNPDTNPPNDQVGWDSNGTFEPAPRQFAFEYQPVANLSTVCLEVGSAAQTDLVALLCYQSCNINANFGYNFWSRSCEKYGCISNRKDGSIGDVSSKGAWALKGDGSLFGFTANDATPANRPIPLSTTESQATIHDGSSKDTSSHAQFNDVSAPAVLNLYYYDQPSASGTAISTSRIPITLTRNDLSMTSTRAITHGLFGHLGYTWDNDRRHPYFGIGASVDIAQHNDYCCGNDKSLNRSDNCDPCCGNTASCLDVGISQWAVWMKTGVAWS